MADENILGPDVSIDAQGAADVLAQRIANIAQQSHPSDNGKTAWGTQGTPYLGDRYNGPSNIPYPSAAPDPAPSQIPVSPAAVDMAEDYGYGRVDAMLASRVAAPYFQMPSVAPLPNYQVATDAPTSPLAPQFAGPRTFGSYKEALDLTHDLTTDLSDRYAQLGRVGDIGGKEYQADRQSILVGAGLLNAPERHRGGILANMKEDWAEPYGKLNYGYAGLQLMQGVASDYAKTNAGQYVSPEQQETANAGLLPGIGAIAGTALGSMIAPGVGSWVGGMIGGGLGSVGASVVGANETREQSTRETAERLAAALGQAADSVGTFKSQIEATGAPVAQLGQSLATVSGVGTFGNGTVAGIGALTNAFQEHAGEGFAEIAKYTATPLLYGLGNRFSTGAAGSSDLVSLGYDAAEQGDFGGLKMFQQLAGDARGKNDPKAQEISKTLGEASGSWWERSAAWVAGELTGNNPLTGLQSDLDARKKELAGGTDADAAAQNALINQFAQLKSQQIVSEAGVKAAGTGIGLTTAEGGSAAQIGAASEGLYAALGAARSATQGEISQLQGDLADPKRSAGRADELRARIADAQARMGGYDVQEAQQRRDVFRTGLGEEDANFSFTVSRATLSGRSAASMLPDYNRQADYLTSIATGPGPLSPTERAGIAQSADQMRYIAGRNVYDERQGWAGVQVTQGQGAIGIAETYGTPMDAYNAQINQIGNEQTQIGIIDDRLRQKIPVSERIPLMNQRQQIENDIAIAPEKARVNAYEAEGSILGSDQAAGRALLGRNAEVYGAKAFTPDIFADDQKEINLWTGAENGSPLGSVQRAKFHRERADAEAQMQHDRDSSYQFGDQATRIGDMTAEGRFERSMKSPWMDGNPDNNPMTAGRSLEAVYRKDLAGVETALRNTPKDSPAYEYNTRLEEQYKDKIADIQAEQRTGFLKFLPEFIGGSPGQGNLAGILPTPGQSAFYNGNPFISGTFGRPNPSQTADGSGHIAQAGGMVGGFLSSSLASSGADSAVVGAINRLIDVVQRGQTTAAGGRSPAMTGSPAGYSANVSQQLNPYKANGQYP